MATLVNELIDVLRPTEQSDRRRRGVFRHIASLVDGCFAGENVLVRAFLDHRVFSTAFFASPNARPAPVPPTRRSPPHPPHPRSIVTAQVTAFGSVPLRTYLPDGDIDVCLLGPHELLSRDDWTVRLRAHVERAEAAAAEASAELGSPVAEFAVSEIHIIHAEVKLMKLICDGVVVDVSANQFGGLAALGFLEEVNAFIGKGEIFKRSIVLIKAWGFYEGRLLGAHHALISTYALETLVLYILNRFHKELSTPLEVLHKFLVFFADFDWDKFAISVHGPVPLEDLDKATGPIGKRPEVHAEGALLTPDFMWRMMDKYGNESVGAKLGGGANSTPRPMARKYLNVVDPLLSSNNLGRSVSQGNAKRIRKALALGAQRLTALRESSTGGECFGAVRMLEQFFGNTMRHRRLGPMPHLPMAPSTPGFAGRNHADEVSMTPARCPRTGAVSVLASPSSPSQYQSPLPRSVDGQPPGSASSRMATKGTAEAPAARTRRKTPVAAGEDGEEDDSTEGGVDGSAPRRLEMGSPEKPRSGSDGAAEDHWPHLERVGTRCPVLQRAENAARAEKAERDLHGEERGPFWGRWDPLPASEAIAQHARAFASEGFPALGDGREGTKGTRCPVLAAAAREEEEVVASAIPSGCPFHAAAARRRDSEAARSDGSSDESSKEAKSTSPTGPLSDGDGEGGKGDGEGGKGDASEKAPAAPAAPPPPPGPPPPGQRTSMDGARARMRREMSCPTFFPEHDRRVPPPPTPAPPVKPGPAVLPAGVGAVSDVFTGDLDAIWGHLQFGRAYHHLAIVQMRAFEAMGGDPRALQQHRFGGYNNNGGGGGRRGAGGAAAFNRRNSRDGGGGRGGHARSGSWGAPGGGGVKPGQPPPPPPGAPALEQYGQRRPARQSRQSRVSEGSDESSEDASRKPGAAHQQHHQHQHQHHQGRRSRDGRVGRGGGGKSGGGPSIVEEAPAGNWSKAVSAKPAAAEKAPGKVGDRDRDRDGDPPPLPPGDPPPLPPGPPPPGTRTSMDGAGTIASPLPAPPEHTRPSWGPKKTAPIDAIRAPPTPPPVPAEEPASPPREATRSRRERPPTAAEGLAAAAKGRLGVAPKGSWSSLVAAGGSSGSSGPGERSSADKLSDKTRTGSVGQASDKREASSAPPSPARPLAGAWAKGNGKDVLAAAAEASRAAAAAAAASKVAAAAASITVSELGGQDAAAGARGARGRSRASSSSGDSNSGEKENSAGKADSPARDGDDDESYLHKVEEFPTLGGVGEGGGGGGGEKAAVGAAWGSGENPWANRGGTALRLQTGG